MDNIALSNFSKLIFLKLALSEHPLRVSPLSTALVQELADLQRIVDGEDALDKGRLENLVYATFRWLTEHGYLTGYPNDFGFTDVGLTERGIAALNQPTGLAKFKGSIGSVLLQGLTAFSVDVVRDLASKFVES